MSNAAQALLKDALALSEAERRELIQALVDSLELEAVEVSPEWAQELQNRIDQVESGQVETVSWDEADARIRQSLGQT